MIEIRDVSVSFGDILAVDRITFRIEAGDKTMIIGETGSGKSVLLQALLRLLSDSAFVTGSVLYEGRDLLQMQRKELDCLRGSQLAYIPQGGGGSLNPLLKIGYQVGETLIEHQAYTKKQAIAAAIPLLRRFQLGNENQLVKSYPHSFSGGMRQRAMIAMGVANNAKWLFADEPTKGLDNERIRQVVDCFLQFKEESLLCVTHDLRFARIVGKRCLVMYAAQVVHDAPVDALFQEPLHPYTRALIDAQPENGLRCNIGFAPLHEEYAVTGCRYAARCPDCTERCAQPPPIVPVGKQNVRCWKYAC